ncbi:hypothetical protein E2C01_077342 [Portunus trituberculatus]|uniref:Uncharacterized protein n=1 Tax=Portunus trituberculatus TaxID=210409 RepID=A0A5B7IR38_PORTR|nr:hypothetical protein [Portunus trituberculatus]
MRALGQSLKEKDGRKLITGSGRRERGGGRSDQVMGSRTGVTGQEESEGKLGVKLRGLGYLTAGIGVEAGRILQLSG